MLSHKWQIWRVKKMDVPFPASSIVSSDLVFCAWASCRVVLTMRGMRKLRWAIGLSLLAFQIGAIAYARFVPSRYFCWAPFDMQTDYELAVTVNGKKLTAKEIQQRYRRAAKGTDNRSFQHLIDIIEQTEQRYHPDDDTHVTMTYQINGKPKQQWHYPPP
jgi:hypothetical protein